jgi:outer membrane protein OmpA-like peptidoglycan-associated protein
MRYIFRLLLLLIAIPAFSQDSLYTRFGFNAGFGINMHTADFRALPGVPNCCPQFESGSGSGPLGGVFTEFALSQSLLIGLRLSYITHDATLSQEEATTVIVNGVEQDGAFTHTVDATLSSIGLEPTLGIRITNGLFANVGLRLGTYLSKEYSQKEEITQPDGVGTFLDSNGNDSKQRVRNESSGEIPNAQSFLAQAVAGVSYELPLNSRRSMLLVPEVSYALSFTDVVDGISWKANGLRAGLALKFQLVPPPPKEKMYDTVVVRDTSIRPFAGISAPQTKFLSRSSSQDTIETSDVITYRTVIKELYERLMPDNKLDATIAAYGVDGDGKESPLATLRIEEFLSVSVQPLLNYLFFDEGRSTFPGRYTQLSASDANSFRLEKLFGKQTLEVYYNVLNIVGYRMRQYPNATLSFIGCNSDENLEKGNTKLSEDRAKTIRDYLVNVWKIAPNRLQSSSRNLPLAPSNPNTPDGKAENRRVEVTSNMQEVIDVFVANDTTRKPDPPIVRFKPTINANEPVVSWNMAVVQSGKQLKNFTGTGAITNVDWDIENDPANAPRYSEPLEVTLVATTQSGNTKTVKSTLPTNVVTVAEKEARGKGDFRIDKFNLILFPFNSFEMTAANDRIIKLVNSRITPESKLVVEGYTDRTGDPASNQRLATKRAESTVTALNRPDATTRGVGEARLLYPNETPEGRFYCRTVQITAKTPIK